MFIGRHSGKTFFYNYLDNRIAKREPIAKLHTQKMFHNTFQVPHKIPGKVRLYRFFTVTFHTGDFTLGLCFPSPSRLHEETIDRPVLRPYITDIVCIRDKHLIFSS